MAWHFWVYFAARRRKDFKLEQFIGRIYIVRFFALLGVISRGKWMGLATPSWLWGLVGFLGVSKGIAAITLAFWLGAIVGVALLYFSKKKYGLKSSIAFGPFMILGTAISFLGEKE